MLLLEKKSLCKPQQQRIVSRDTGYSREHRIDNSPKGYKVRQYRLDKGLVDNTKCCDFLVLNDSRCHAYFIELKGGHLEDAVPQLEGARRLLEKELEKYTFYYRIVTSKTRTHNIQKPVFRRFMEQCRGNLKYGTEKIEEVWH